GAGAIGGCFVHERHGKNFDLPRLAGWWGHDKVERFRMDLKFRPMEGAEGWQLSNPPILSLVALRVALEIFDRVKLLDYGVKREQLSEFLRFLIGADLKFAGWKLVTPV